LFLQPEPAGGKFFLLIDATVADNWALIAAVAEWVGWYWVSKGSSSGNPLMLFRLRVRRDRV